MSAAGHTSRLAGWVIALALLALAVLFAADRLYHSESFAIREVEVHGRFADADGARTKALRAVVEQSLSGNYFSLNLNAVEARIAALPWVFSASVRRQWPDTLVVDVAEVQPVATWGRAHWLNFSGDLVARPRGAAARNLPALPALSGPDDRHAEVWRAFRGWSELFAANGLRLDELRLDARGLWYLTLSLSALAKQSQQADLANAPPVTLIVEHAHAEARIARFVAALRAHLIGDFAEMRVVDLRYPNGFAVSRYPDSAAADPQLARSEQRQ